MLVLGIESSCDETGVALYHSERGLLAEALGMTGGVKKRAAQLLSISFRSFRYRLEKLGLDGDSHEL